MKKYLKSLMPFEKPQYNWKCQGDTWCRLELAFWITRLLESQLHNWHPTPLVEKGHNELEIRRHGTRFDHVAWCSAGFLMPPLQWVLTKLPKCLSFVGKERFISFYAAVGLGTVSNLIIWWRICSACWREERITN